MITIHHDHVPYPVKEWLIKLVYHGTDFWYEMADDSHSYNRGMKQVENFYTVFFQLFPDVDERLVMAGKLDPNGQFLFIPRISKETNS